MRTITTVIITAGLLAIVGMPIVSASYTESIPVDIYNSTHKDFYLWSPNVNIPSGKSRSATMQWEVDPYCDCIPSYIIRGKCLEVSYILKGHGDEATFSSHITWTPNNKKGIFKQKHKKLFDWGKWDITEALAIHDKYDDEKPDRIVLIVRSEPDSSYY